MKGISGAWLEVELRLGSVKMPQQRDGWAAVGGFSVKFRRQGVTRSGGFAGEEGKQVGVRLCWERKEKKIWYC